jgi:hypothetical protein
MPLKAFEDFAPEPLAFPIGGKVYTAKLVGMSDGLRLQRVLEGKDDSLNDVEPEVLWRMVLGDAWDEMMADNVPVEAASRAALAALADFQYGRNEAERVWEAGISPEALAARAAANQKASTPSTRTGGAGKTRSRASSSGTRKSPKN